MSDATMELIKGAKKQAIADDLDDAPAAETQEVDIEKMTVPQLDALVADNGLEVPEDWKKMNKAAKIAYLQEKYGSETESGEAAEAGDDATVPEGASTGPETGDVEQHPEEQKAALDEAKATTKKASKSKTPAKAAVEGEVLLLVSPTTSTQPVSKTSPQQLR